MSVTVVETNEELVKKGAALLDDRCPGWATIINLETLTMSSVQKCVLGQVFGNFATGLSILCLKDDGYGANHGFVCRGKLGNCSCNLLRQLWLTEIQVRLNSGRGTTPP